MNLNNIIFLPSCNPPANRNLEHFTNPRRQILITQLVNSLPFRNMLANPNHEHYILQTLISQLAILSSYSKYVKRLYTIDLVRDSQAVNIVLLYIRFFRL